MCRCNMTLARIETLLAVLVVGTALTAAHAAAAVGVAGADPAAATTAAAASPASVPAPATSTADQREEEKAALTLPSVQTLRPSGPIEISADRAELSQGKTMIYTGDVKLRSNTLELDGTRMQAQQGSSGQVHAVIDGNPAQLHHPGTGPGDPPVSAHARQMTYDSATSIVELDGDAVLSRGENQIHGQNIRYNVSQRAVEAAGGAGGQVHIVIQPPASASSAAPKPSATNAAPGGGAPNAAVRGTSDATGPASPATSGRTP